MRTNLRGLVLVLAALALFATACGAEPGESAAEEAPAEAVTSTEDSGSTGEEEPAGESTASESTEGGELSGTIDIDGSSTVFPLSSAIAEEFRTEAPGVTVNVASSGTGGGFERFCGTGDTEISDASRPIEEQEAALCEENGIEYVEVRVGTDALTMVVNPQTEFVECLTREQVQAIWTADSAATNWNQVNPEYPDTELQVFAPGADSGTYDFFNEVILDEGMEPRQEYTASEDDNVLVQGITGTPGAWGYFGYAYYQANQDRLKVVAYDAGEGCVLPSEETVQDDSYQLARPLFIYVRSSALAEDPAVAEFVTFYLDKVNEVIDQVGYIRAPDDALEESRSEVEAAISGG